MRFWLSVVLLVYKGIIFSFCWNLLIPPLGVIEISIWHGIALCTFIQLFTTLHPFAPVLTKFGDDYTEEFIYESLGYTSVFLIIGTLKFFFMEV